MPTAAAGSIMPSVLAVLPQPSYFSTHPPILPAQTQKNTDTWQTWNIMRGQKKLQLGKKTEEMLRDQSIWDGLCSVGEICTGRWGGRGIPRVGGEGWRAKQTWEWGQKGRGLAPRISHCQTYEGKQEEVRLEREGGNLMYLTDRWKISSLYFATNGK